MKGNRKARRVLGVGTVVVALALGVAGCNPQSGKTIAKGAGGAAAGAGGCAAACK
jgi:hypothetical protein